MALRVTMWWFRGERWGVEGSPEGSPKGRDQFKQKAKTAI